VIELDPGDAQAHYNLGELHYDLGNLKKAEQECRKAVELDPGFSYAYLTLGNICLDQDHNREALHWFQEFLMRERDPGATEIRDEVAAVVEGLKAEM
jgi:tetratricopeptide (TPR) repeat protein